MEGIIERVAVVTGIMIALVKLLDWILLPSQKKKLSSVLDTLWIKLSYFNSRRLLLYAAGKYARRLAVAVAFAGMLVMHVSLLQMWVASQSPPDILRLILGAVVFYGLLIVYWFARWGLYDFALAGDSATLVLGKLLAVGLVNWLGFYLLYQNLGHVPGMSEISNKLLVRAYQGSCLVAFLSLLEAFVIVSYSCFLMFGTLLAGICLVAAIKALTASLSFVVLRIAESPGGPIAGLSVLLVALGALVAALQ